MAKRTFTGGIHPPAWKHLTNDQPIENVPLPGELFLPLSHDGKTIATLSAVKGTRVKRGDLLGRSTLPIHSPVNGIIKDIIEHPCSKSPYLPTFRIQADSDVSLSSHIPPSQPSSSETRKKILEGNINTFSPQPENLSTILQDLSGEPGEWCILNGVETEPYLNSERRILLEFPDEVLQGFKLLWDMIQSKQAHIAFLRTDQDVISQWKKLISAQPKIRVIECDLKYPQEAEPVLVHSITGKKLGWEEGGWKRKGLTVNASTAKAVYDWVYRNQMTFDRVVTVAGPVVQQPKNLRVTFGTPIREVLKLVSVQEPVGKLVLGGPVGGSAHFSFDMPVTPDISGIILYPPEQAILPNPQPCIHCARCIEVCPTLLIPSELSHSVVKEKWKKFKSYHYDACIECGACAYVCPSYIPLVHDIRLGKKKMQEKEV